MRQYADISRFSADVQAVYARTAESDSVKAGGDSLDAKSGVRAIGADTRNPLVHAALVRNRDLVFDRLGCHLRGFAAGGSLGDDQAARFHTNFRKLQSEPRRARH
jgi:hypothetical protein